jgi:hypothetical protein
MGFARWLFSIASTYGLAVLVPQYFLAEKVAPGITRPEYFYGFLGVAIAWQIAFAIISQDPLRFRPMMIPSALEKLSFTAATLALYAQGRVSGVILMAGCVDFVFAVLFLIAWWRLGKNADSA